MLSLLDLSILASARDGEKGRRFSAKDDFPPPAPYVDYAVRHIHLRAYGFCIILILYIKMRVDDDGLLR